MNSSQQTRSPRKAAVVTGANSGIGQAIAERLAAAGAKVLLVARDSDSLGRVRRLIEEAGGQAEVFACDITVRSTAQAIVERARERLGGLDILVNCASATSNEGFFDLTDDQWLMGFEVKVFAAIRLCRAAWPLLRESRGSIVNIGGIGARTPGRASPMTGALSTSLLALTKSLANRGVDDGVQVNAINPGMIRTPRIERTFALESGDVGEKLDSRAAEMGTTRVGAPADVAELVNYIVSPSGDFLQGALIDLDGGATKGL